MGGGKIRNSFFDVNNRQIFGKTDQENKRETENKQHKELKRASLQILKRLKIIGENYEQFYVNKFEMDNFPEKYDILN